MDEGYAHIGALLRRAREETHITIEYAARELHIRPRYLQALEEGRVSDIPGATYAKGYLQAYASYLHLDKNEMLRRFENIEGVLARQRFFLPQVFSKDKHPQGGIIYSALLLAALVYAVWVWLLKPESTSISVIDTPVGIEERHRVAAAMELDVACLKPQETLYPPCTCRAPEAVPALPISRQFATIMELAKE